MTLASALAIAMLGSVASQAQGSTGGGPVILMGLDSELEPGQAGHGTPDEHAAMVAALLGDVTNGGEGILVIGDGSRVRDYWEGDVGNHPAVNQPVTFVSGVEDIENVNFAGYAMIGVASSTHQLPSGQGLTNAENEALIARANDIAAFVNSGGGLLGKTQDGLSSPFGYVDPLGAFEPVSTSYSSVLVTQAGLDLGLTQSGMDGWCCYHEVFDSFPHFMEVLITHDAGGTHQGKAAAVGGVRVTIETDPAPQPSDDDPAVRLVKFWFDADGNRVGAPDDDWTVSLLVGAEVRASVDASDGSDWTPVSGNYSVTESNAPDDWEEVSCAGLNLPDIGTDYLDNSGTGDFSASTTGAHAVCNQQPEVLAEVLEEAEPAEPVEAEPTFTG